jgi:hypothetical protein
MKISIPLIKNKLLVLVREQRILVSGFMVLSLLLIIKTYFPKTTPVEKSLPEQVQIGTLIPIGFVLIPIQIQNFESASPLIGSAGVVDLWSFDPTTQRKTKKVASRLKILRAPLNPQMYAVLVPEKESSRILEFGDTFLVTVQSDRSDSPEILQEKKVSRSFIETFEMKE